MERNEPYADWIGKSQTMSDYVDGKQPYLMDSLINNVSGGSPWQKGRQLPPLWHWCYFPVATPLDEIGADGHPEKGGFLPPLELPRRMWAGSRLEFRKPIGVGDAITKRSVIRDIAYKEGRSGSLCFVTLSHETLVDDQVAIYEEQDIVYRQPVAADAPVPKPVVMDQQPDQIRIVQPSEVMLFIYSALTFNSHRIHYDRDYCRDEEGLADLLVHGPLTATLLVGFAEEHNQDRKLKSFNFRAVSPLHCSNKFTLNARIDTDKTVVWADNHEGHLSMRAEAVFE